MNIRKKYLLVTTFLVIGFLQIPKLSFCKPVTLTDTGQDKCYDIIGEEIDCPAKGQPLYGQDAQYVGTAKVFRDNGNYTVTDVYSKLMWQQYTADVDENYILDDNDRIHQSEAINFCEKLVFAGYDDWRLPEKYELESILDYTRIDPAIDPIFSSYATYYWSATETANHDYVAWEIAFSNAQNFTATKFVARALVRCVRNVGTNTFYSSYSNNGNTVIDNRTSLEWEKG